MPEKVQRLLTTLYEKAKREPDFRFYTLYDKIYREDILYEAYRHAKSNGGGPGVDGQSFKDVEALGLQDWLGLLAKELREKTYKPEAIKRTLIRKPNGKMRPLGIPTLKDRVAQTAAAMILGCIFEADLADEQYAYRPGRNVGQAVQKVQCLLNRDGHREVVDADLSGYFDNIPHPQLMKELGIRIADKAVLHLIKMWLEAPAEEKDKKTKKVTRTTVNRDQRVGTPQGSPISPLLSNIYMRRFIQLWKDRKIGKLYGSEIVNYADDLVICCRRNAEEAMKNMRKIMGELGLTVNEEKTKVVHMPEGNFVFLGYEFRLLYSWKKRKMYLGARPSQKAMSKLMEKVHDLTDKSKSYMEASEVVGKVNKVVRGWANNFQVGAVSKAYKMLNNYIISRFRHWFGRKHKWKTKGYKSHPDEKLREEFKLIDLYKLVPNYNSCAKS